jgi:S1-C subfamily serine protease
MCELRPWGIVGTRLSRQTIQQNTLPDTEGVLIVSVDGGGAASVAEPSLKEGDVIRAINGQTLHDVDQLRTLTAQALGNTNETKTIRVSVLRQGALLDSTLTLGLGRAATTRQTTRYRQRKRISHHPGVSPVDRSERGSAGG